MCGIGCYVGNEQAAQILYDILLKLKHRGYDSAGIAVENASKINCVKVFGDPILLESKIKGVKGTCGIGHNRWATQGNPSHLNAHPHCDCSKKIYVVHNGDIFNWRELREGLENRGHKFRTETDTEVIAHAIEDSCQNHGFVGAVAEALNKLVGTYALAIIHNDYPGKIVLAKMGSPLTIGLGNGWYMAASDDAGIVKYTREITRMDDGQIAVLCRENPPVITDLNRVPVISVKEHIDWSVEEIQKGGYPHFMVKEIHEQPDTVQKALGGEQKGRLKLFLAENSQPVLGGLRGENGKIERRLRDIKKIIIVSCGTSYHASLVGEYMLEEYAGIPTKTVLASEFVYRKQLLDKKTAVIAISQSGETADTIKALKEAKNKGVLTLGIVNVVGSTIARMVDAGIYCQAGREIAVASTKAFISQLTVLALMTLMLARQREMSAATARSIAKELAKIPAKIRDILKEEEAIKAIAKKYAKHANWLYLGREYSLPAALEGALKIKEISSVVKIKKSKTTKKKSRIVLSVHAEGCAAGEMKHGPIALIGSNFASMFVVPNDSVAGMTIKNMEEIKTREGKIVAIATKGDKRIAKIADDTIYIPATIDCFNPILATVAMQLFAYYVAVTRGCDVDQPPNLAKVVTVE